MKAHLSLAARLASSMALGHFRPTTDRRKILHGLRMQPNTELVQICSWVLVDKWIKYNPIFYLCSFILGTHRSDSSTNFHESSLNNANFHRDVPFWGLVDIATRFFFSGIRPTPKGELPCR